MLPEFTHSLCERYGGPHAYDKNQIQRMNVLDLELPDLSDHPPPPQVTLDVYEKGYSSFWPVACAR